MQSVGIAADELRFTRDVDLIYHKEGGYALTMDRVAPVTNANGAAVVMVVSGRWISKREFLAPQVADRLPGVAKGILVPTELLARGYTVFYVVHGAQPTFTIPDIHAQLSAAVRHIRHNAEHYGVDPSRIGIMGGSAGGTSVAVLQASPLAKVLFHRAIGQSGAPFHPMRHRTRNYTFAPSGESNGLRFGTGLVGEQADRSIAALRKVPARKIYEVTQTDQAFRIYEYFAMVDGEVLVEDVATAFANGHQADVPTTVGSTSDESSVPVDHLSAIMGGGAKGFNRFAASMLPEVSNEIPTYYPAAADDQTPAGQCSINTSRIGKSSTFAVARVAPGYWATTIQQESPFRGEVPRKVMIGKHRSTKKAGPVGDGRSGSAETRRNGG